MSAASDAPPAARWEHFRHGSDVGVRGLGATQAEAFEQAALALTAVACDPARVEPRELQAIDCAAPDSELLLVDFLNALIYLSATRRLLFGRVEVRLETAAPSGQRLSARAWGEPVDAARHEPAVEVKGATLTALAVGPRPEGGWLAQCVVDV